MMEGVIAFFRDLWEFLFQWGQNYLSRYQYLAKGEYYEDLFTRYFSVEGFLVGLVFVGFLFWASHEDQKVSDFIKIVVSVAVINSCRVVMELAYNLFGVEQDPGDLLRVFCPAHNLISGFLVTLVVSSYYRKHGARALMFGLATYSAVFFLRMMDLEMEAVDDWLAGLFAIVILSALVCPIISKMKHFFTGWIWFFGVFTLEKLGALVAPTALRLSEQENGLAGLAQMVPALVRPRLGEFKVDLLAFGAVLVFAIVFEALVLPSGKKGNQSQSQSAAGTA